MEKIEKGVEYTAISLTVQEIKHIRSAITGFIEECKNNGKMGYLASTVNELEVLLDWLPKPEGMAINEAGQFYNINYELRKTYTKV